MFLPLIPLEEVNEVKSNIEGIPEGAQSIVTVNRYERSRANRQACLSFYGFKCKICGFDFEEKYKDLGKGFIEVHHIIPIALMGEGYIVNPVKDLIPICANCHAIVHKRLPPYSIEEIQAIINNRKL